MNTKFTRVASNINCSAADYEGKCASWFVCKSGRAIYYLYIENREFSRFEFFAKGHQKQESWGRKTYSDICFNNTDFGQVHVQF